MLAHPTWSAVLLGLSDIVCLGMLLVAAGLLFAGAAGALAAMLALACMALFRVWRSQRLNQAVKRALLAAGEVQAQPVT
jgi:predicted lipid-binding transport protein (Tim44 family)